MAKNCNFPAHLKKLLTAAAVFFCTAGFFYGQNIAVQTASETAVKTVSSTSTPRYTLGLVGGLSVPNTAYAQNAVYKYIEQYTKPFGKQQIYDVLDGGEMYRLYVRQELKKRGMPAALEYLPFVESDYNPKAVSRSGAKGLWQFMDNSIAGLLKKNEWEDQRYDPWKSTDAALSKLQENYKTFKDWPIAIAAYNCGAGAMKKILRNAKTKTFWYISEKGLLRDQSVQYVPKLLAICQLSEKGELYGVELPEITKSSLFADFDYVSVKNSIYLDRLASELKMSPSILENLNPSLLKGCTPPYEYKLRLPSGMASSAILAINSIKKSSAASTSKTYTVKKGDTLYSISKKYGVSVEQLRKLNGLSKDSTLSIGKTLYLN